MAINTFKQLLVAAAFTAYTGFSHATIVLIETSAGDIQVNLHDDTTPETVANFLNYVTDGAYNDGFFHRLIPGFIVQSGGYYFTDTSDLDSVESIASKGTVVNEPVYSNVAGTIAMAKIACSPNSATSEWFINIADNSAGLDTQNAGFTVFGEVISGMEYMPTIADSPASKIDFVAINAISIIGGVQDTSDQLESEPVLNTLISGAGDTNSGCDNSSSGGGSTAPWLLILILTTLGLGRRTKI